MAEWLADSVRFVAMHAGRGHGRHGWHGWGWEFMEVFIRKDDFNYRYWRTTCWRVRSPPPCPPPSLGVCGVGGWGWWWWGVSNRDAVRRRRVPPA